MFLPFIGVFILTSSGRLKKRSASWNAASTRSSGIGWSTSVLRVTLTVSGVRQKEVEIQEGAQEADVASCVHELLLDLLAAGLKVTQADLRDADVLDFDNGRHAECLDGESAGKGGCEDESGELIAARAERAGKSWCWREAGGRRRDGRVQR